VLCDDSVYIWRCRHFRLRVRSYRNPPQEFAVPAGHQWTIKQAVCASSAAAIYFEPFAIAKNPYTLFRFEDASFFGANNPSKLAYRELSEHPDFMNREVGCFVSIGTGKRQQQIGEEDGEWFRRMVRKSGAKLARTSAERQKIEQLASSFGKMATDSEVVHEELMRSRDL
jgi:hypothetical protein